MKKQELPEKFKNSKTWSYFFDKKGALKRVPKKQTSISKIRKEAEEASYGTELGKYKAHGKKPWLLSFKEHIGHWIDKFDPVEGAGIIVGTILIKTAIEASEEITATLIAKAAILNKNASLKGAWALSGIIAGPLGGAITTALLPEDEKTKKLFMEAFDSPTVEALEWLTSFFIAVLMVRHGGEIFAMLIDGGKGLQNVVTAIFAA